MTHLEQIAQTLRQQVHDLYEALHWGGLEAEVRAVCLHMTLRAIEQYTTIHKPWMEKRTEAKPSPQTSAETVISRLVFQAHQALHTAQELGVFPSLLAGRPSPLAPPTTHESSGKRRENWDVVAPRMDCEGWRAAAAATHDVLLPL
jgi:hypothetical protein